MERIKCGTFNKDIQDSIPKEIREKMKADRAEAEKKQETKGLNTSLVSNNEVTVCEYGTEHKFMKEHMSFKVCPYCLERL